MAKTKADWLQEAQKLGLEVTEKNTVAEIQAAIKAADQQQAVTPEDAASTSATENEAEDTGVETDDAEERVTKAGKRSAKARREAAEEEARQARKEEAQEEEAAKKGPAPKTRTQFERRSKAYRKAGESYDRKKEYPLKEAAEQAIKNSTTKFDGSVEMHIRLNVDPRQADQNIRDSLTLPHGTGKSVRVAAFVDGDDAKAAKEAGADVAGAEDITKKLEKEDIDFDVLIATPKQMPQLGKYARLLGPKGLMPNPKSGTVTNNVAQAVSEAKAGRVEYRVDSGGIVHLGIGKVSFGSDKIVDNAQAVLDSIRANRPGSIKGAFLLSVTLAPSMGPGVKVEFEQRITL